MAKDWWLRASEARTLKNQLWTWNDFQEEFKKEYIPRWGNLTVAQYTAKFNRLAKYCLRLIDTDENKTRQFVKGLRVELQRALAPLPPMGFAVAVEAATRTEMADQAVIQRKTTIGSATAPYKRPGQGPWKPRDFKRSRSHRICTYCGRSGHVAEMCYRKLRLCFKCGKPGHTKDQCPEMQQVTPEMSRKAGRPPVMRGTTEGRNNKPQVKAKVYALDGSPVDTEAEVVEGMIKIFSQPARVLIDP
ncbi:hypothetical protein M9H77_26492 [Catharanthus roseus]|uniref:Uncharacterized protein n=1 Tax=Catharanthus roseus TaxID=4058 RepID=A0ACC0AA68_CATRO|nr:hypothetical protein M9H77_26492 [Catharanthus roseus]